MASGSPPAMTRSVPASTAGTLPGHGGVHEAVRERRASPVASSRRRRPRSSRDRRRRRPVLRLRELQCQAGRHGSRHRRPASTGSRPDSRPPPPAVAATGRSPPASSSTKARAVALGPVPDGQVMTRAGDPPRHRRPHPAGAEDRDVSHGADPRRSCRGPRRTPDARIRRRRRRARRLGRPRCRPAACSVRSSSAAGRSVSHTWATVVRTSISRSTRSASSSA